MHVSALSLEGSQLGYMPLLPLSVFDLPDKVVRELAN